MAIKDSAEVLNFVPEHSTNDICVGEAVDLCLTDHLEAMETDIASKAPMSHSHGEYLSEDDAVAAFAMANHTHGNYLTEDDAVAAFAMAEHTHTGFAASEHTHTDLVETMDALDTAIGGKAEATHTHAQSDVAGLVDKLAEIDEAIEALQAAGGESGGAPAPMLTLAMHLGKLDNNSGAEVSSSTRICSEPFAVENGKSYWQVNDKAVNMYVLLYDADEVFLDYLGNFASGAEIAVSNADAAYMRLGSLLGNYDLTNNFYIYDTDPAGGAVEEEEAFTQADADLLYAPISHTHDGYAPATHTHDYAAPDHTHDGYAASSHTHTAADITGLENFAGEPVNTICAEFTDSGIGTNFFSLTQETINPLNIVSASVLVYFSDFPVTSSITEPRASTLPVRDESGDIVMSGYINQFGKLVVSNSKNLGSYTVKAIYKYTNPEAN